MQKSLTKDYNKYKEIDNLFDKIININNNKYNYSEIQNEILNLIIKNSNYKIQLIENKYNLLLNKVKQDIKNDYIEELEKQIEYRDNIIKEFNINISNSKLFTLIKDLETLRKENKNKLEKANISPNIPLFQIQNTNTSINYISALTNPNNYNADQSYGTIVGVSSKRNLSHLRKKTNTNIISNKNNPNNNRIPSNYNKGGGNSLGGLVKNSSCSKMNVKKFQKNNNIINNTNLNLNNPQAGIHSNNKGNSPIPPPLSNKIFSKNFCNNINSLKRNTKSFVCNNSNKEISINYNSNNTKKKDKEKRHKSAIGVLNINEHNNSYSNDDYYYIYNKNNANYWSDRLMTVEQMPRFKKSDINNKINEKNLKRQKFLDRVNADIKDLL